MFPPARVIYSSIFFILVMTLVVVTKPAVFFLSDGRIRPFGIGQSVEHTALPLGAVVVLVAVSSMFIFGTIDVVYSDNRRYAAGVPGMMSHTA
jgi:hypothetical protein